jgi:Ca2+-transporting ATPase
VIFQWPIALFPVHIVFLELIIDPACSVVFEAERAEKDIMDRAPRTLGEPLFGKQEVIMSLIQGLTILAGVIAVYWWSLADHSEQAARALAFTALVVANLGLILTNRSHSRSILKILRTPSPTTWWVIGGTLTFLILILGLPTLQKLFHFESLHRVDIVICLGVAVLSIILMEMLKLKPIRSILGISR